MSDRCEVLIVDDEAEVRRLLARLVRQEGLEPLEAADGPTALGLLDHHLPEVMLLDTRMPGMDGMDVLREVRRRHRDLPVVMVTSNVLARDAVLALRAGAHDYVVKPFEHGEVIRAIREARHDAARPRRVLAAAAAEPLAALMGPSAAVAAIDAAVSQVAESNLAVLITGETGAGKEVVAAAIHQRSRRAGDPFIAVDCGAIPESLFESELFGHRKGAFTGADHHKRGKLEAVGAGTLVLDEVGNLLPTCQAKLLRVLEERRVTPLGAIEPVPVDLRLLAATNSNLDGLVAEGKFREDLYFRLNEFVIAIPPLRERPADVAYLAERFLAEANRELGRSVAGLTAEALEVLLAHRWPGNARELRSVIRRVVLAGPAVIGAEHLQPLGAGAFSVARAADDTLKDIVRRSTANAERAALAAALQKTGGNKAEAARMLQIDYKTLLGKAREYGLTTVRPYTRRPKPA